MAVPQKDKVRVIMNLSYPDGDSFNDYVDENRLEKVHMTTARSFGYEVVQRGRNARMWKYDLKDAYKNVPARTQDLRCQGFTWLGKHFIESQQVFGAKSAVAAFDKLGHTLLDIAAAQSGTRNSDLHRCLDDVPFVTSQHDT